MFSAVAGPSALLACACSALIIVIASRAAACSASFLLDPSPTPNWRAADADSGDEALGVIGSALADHFVNRMGAEMTMGGLLQLGLVVAFHAGSTDVVAKQPLHHLLRLDQPAVGVNRPDQRLEPGGQDRGLLPPAALFLTFAQQQAFAQADRFGLGGQRARR